eukprot:TRINITY_DN948_c0_g1_i1.p1 TRINITY_DN948_c0_g1~~TRINITY_DN948_c0_g1_i1.p1  ORF type:complete len:434 (-),score=95.96 TRINITY_DN948_c0_g1_i1:135-1436(-)
MEYIDLEKCQKMKAVLLRNMFSEDDINDFHEVATIGTQRQLAKHGHLHSKMYLHAHRLIQYTKPHLFNKLIQIMKQVDQQEWKFIYNIEQAQHTATYTDTEEDTDTDQRETEITNSTEDSNDERERINVNVEEEQLSSLGNSVSDNDNGNDNVNRGESNFNKREESSDTAEGDCGECFIDTTCINDKEATRAHDVGDAHSAHIIEGCDTDVSPVVSDTVNLIEADSDFEYFGYYDSCDDDTTVLCAFDTVDGDTLNDTTSHSTDNTLSNTIDTPTHPLCVISPSEDTLNDTPPPSYSDTTPHTTDSPPRATLNDHPAPGVNVRVVEYHTYVRHAGLTQKDHFDGGSLLTMVIMLSTPDIDFTGGVLQTWDGDDRFTKYDLKRGDCVVFPSHKYHSVTEVTSGTRQIVAVEMWEGEEGEEDLRPGAFGHLIPDW